ncbi:hypothetical protein D9M69_411490 [compost metagenome]
MVADGLRQFRLAEMVAADTQDACIRADAQAGVVDGPGDHPAPAAQGACRGGVGREGEQALEVFLGEPEASAIDDAVEVVEHGCRRGASLG